MMLPPPRTRAWREKVVSSTHSFIQVRSRCTYTCMYSAEIERSMVLKIQFVAWIRFAGDWLPSECLGPHSAPAMCVHLTAPWRWRGGMDGWVGPWQTLFFERVWAALLICGRELTSAADFFTLNSIWVRTLILTIVFASSENQYSV